MNNTFVVTQRNIAVAVIALLSACHGAAFADPLNLVWSRTYTGLGGAEGRGVTVSPEGIYVTGITWPSGGDWHTWDLCLLKYDLDGTLIWSRTWGGTNYEDGGRVSASSSHVYVAGQTYSYAYDPAGDLEGDAITVKWTHDGVLDCSNSPNCWFTRFSGDSGYYGPENETDIAHDGAGDFYVSGYSERAFGNYWAFVEKYDDAGVKQWHQHWGGSGYLKSSFATGLALSGNTLYAGGTSNQYAANYQVMALNYTTDGALVWSHLWGEPGTDCYAADIAVDGGDLYATGSRGPAANPSAWDALVLKLHDNGASASYVGSTTFSNGGMDFGQGITVADGRVYVVGIATPADNGDAVLLVYDTDLNLSWQRTWGGSGNDAAYDVACSNGVVYVTGGLGGTAFLDAYELDSDSDGVPDASDNCPTVPNANQSNLDGDSFGDACDPCPFDPTNTKVDGQCIPTLSEWGMVAMAALMLAAGVVVVSRRRAVG